MKLKNRAIITAVLVFSLPAALCSCTGYTEIENMDILTSHFVYKDEDKILLGGGVANVRSLSDSIADSPVNYISARGDTLHSAAENLRRSADHKLFYGGMRALVIGEQYARGGIGEFLDYIGSTPDHRTSVSVFTSSAQPRDIVEYRAINDFSGGFAAESIVRTMQNEKQMIQCSLSDIWEARVQRQAGFVVPDIEISDDVMSVNGYSVFDGEIKTAHISPEMSAPLNYILGKEARGQYVVDTPEGTYAVTANMSKKHLSVTEEEEGALHVSASFVFDLLVTPPQMDTMTQQQSEFVQQSIADTLNSEISRTLNMAKSSRCDFLKLYKVYQTQNRNRFFDVDWRDMISQMSISTDVTIGRVRNNLAR